MLNALLVSSGFSSEKVVDLVKSIINDKGYSKGVVITTAHPKRENAHWSKITKEQLELFGLEMGFVDFSKGESIGEDIDLIYVTGGNTFELLKYAKDVNFKADLDKFFERGGLYIGSSAGALILSKDITSAAEISPDENEIGLEDLSGLGYVDFHFVPHYRKEMEVEVERFKKLTEHEVKVFRNGEGIYLKGDSALLLN